MEAELTKLLRHGYGLLTVKVHGHRIAALDTTLKQTRFGYGTVSDVLQLPRSDA